MDQQRKFLAAGVGTIALVAGGLWWMTGDAAKPRTETAAAAMAVKPAPAPPGMLRLDDRQMARVGVRFASATQAGDVPLASLPAVIVPSANARVAVAATLPGVITRTFVIEGQDVRAGQTLATVSSRAVLTMGADLARSRAKLNVTRSSAGRLNQLSREGVIAASRADEANAMVREGEIDLSEKSRLLGVSNASGQSGTYTLSAPIGGRVTMASAQAGSPVDGTSAPFVIDAANRYQVEAQLPERLVGIVRPGMAIRYGADVGGKVETVGSTIDPATRSATLRASIGAAPGIVTGAATTVTVFGPAPQDGVSVPSGAITSLNGADVVFVRVPGGVMVRKVVTGGASNGVAVLLSGVRVGEQVVISGTTELKSLALSQ